MVVPVTGSVPDPASFDDPDDRDAAERALEYMGLAAGTARSRTSASTGCSSARARTRESRTCAPPRRSSRAVRVDPRVTALVVPGSAQVRRQAEEEGLDRVFLDAGFEWRLAGCSMCLGDEPRRARARRALRLDVQPELRGATGPRRPHAPRQPRRWPRPPRCTATSSTSGSSSASRCPREGASRGDRPGGGARPPRRRHRPDHPEAVPEADRAHRATGSSCSTTGATTRTASQRPGFELNRPEFARRVDPARRPQLRLRLVARARRVGAAGLRLRRRRRPVVRRHLPHERRQERAGRDRAARRRGEAADGARRPRHAGRR